MNGHDETLLALVWALREYAETSERVIERSGNAHGVHRTDMRTLSLLMRRQRDGERTTPSDLGRLLGLTSASATALVDRLVNNGHAERARWEQDRRSVTITHTDTAAHTGQQIFMPIARHTADGLAQFSEDELATTIRVLRVATEALLTVEQELDE